MHPCRAASKGPRRTSVPGVLGRRRAAGGEHRLLEVLHVTVPPLPQVRKALRDDVTAHPIGPYT